MEVPLAQNTLDIHSFYPNLLFLENYFSSCLGKSLLKVLKRVSDFTIISPIFDTCVDPEGILISKHLIKMKKVQCALFGLPIPRILKKIAVI